MTSPSETLSSKKYDNLSLFLKFFVVSYDYRVAAAVVVAVGCRL